MRRLNTHTEHVGDRLSFSRNCQAVTNLTPDALAREAAENPKHETCDFREETRWTEPRSAGLHPRSSQRDQDLPVGRGTCGISSCPCRLRRILTSSCAYQSQGSHGRAESAAYGRSPLLRSHEFPVSIGFFSVEMIRGSSRYRIAAPEAGHQRGLTSYAPYVDALVWGSREKHHRIRWWCLHEEDTLRCFELVPVPL
ncbi:hypothetical protein PYCCODRAFT_1056594 [Trametes coccinea BRFM310]|uniref:Uncharacterized protein n=1 Tax=Trametes coccinea (strain BRFM310) TaxID=1353009 RepID=A0A1Y2IZ11_TRAC3|nr:hypothetical protein PYCCODRAFT_1056594 [Trametes coccinea BRFM310]